MIKFFAFGYSGMLFAVFSSTDAAWAYAEETGGDIACFDGFENAVCCFETLGM